MTGARARLPRPGDPLYIGVTRDFDPLRSDPRFQDLLKRIGVGAHQSAAGAASPGQ